ncbi:MAG TPA: hypothetical protein VHE35_25725, partial [Kofleriaceae bacterium]|nr:hypothetical protein [Kofleriaceae bacterium]
MRRLGLAVLIVGGLLHASAVAQPAPVPPGPPATPTADSTSPPVTTPPATPPPVAPPPAEPALDTAAATPATAAVPAVDTRPIKVSVVCEATGRTKVCPSFVNGFIDANKVLLLSPRAGADVVLYVTATQVAL